jgi:site-specific DNA recombinase
VIRRDELESAVLDGLQHELMDPALCEIFAEEYTRHMKRLQIERNASVEICRAELVKVRRDIERIVDAIVGGVPGGQLLTS